MANSLPDRCGRAASPKVVAIVQRQGARWYAEKVVAPLLAYDYESLGIDDVRAQVERHMEGLPEPLRAECRAAIAQLATDERQADAP